MKMSSKKTMLTAAVLVALSSGTTFAATPGTLDSQELFHANRLVTDPVKKPTVEENSGADRYEASITAQKKESVGAAMAQPAAKQASQPARLRWDSVDARLAARNSDPSFSLSAQKAKPVIITAEDIRREEKLAAKEGRPVNELVGDVNMNRPTPPPRPKKPAPPTDEQSAAFVPSATASMAAHGDASAVQGQNNAQVSVAHGGTNIPATVSDRQAPMQINPSDVSAAPHIPTSPHTGAQVSGQQHAAMAQMHTEAVASSAQAGTMGQSASVLPSGTVAAVIEAQQPPARPRYAQMPHEQFSLTPPAENGAAPRQPESFEVLGTTNMQHPAVAPVKDQTPAVEHSVRPDGVPEMGAREMPLNSEADLVGVSDEVRRHILAGQLAMEVQLQRDPTVAGMRAITKVLRENTTLTRLQKIDFLIGFGRALHRSGLPRQQEALLIKTIADAF